MALDSFKDGAFDVTNQAYPYISFHWQKIEDLKGHDSFVALTQDDDAFDWLVHTTPYLAIIFKML